MSVAVLLLAAGGSTRMRGGDKLLECLDGEALLRRSVRVALGSRAEVVIAVTGANRTAREAVLAGLPIRTVFNENWSAGMGASISAGAKVLFEGVQFEGIDGVIVMPADMPDLSPALLNHLIDARPTDTRRIIVRPRTKAGKPGNPVLFGADYLPELMALEGDSGARKVIDCHSADLFYVDTKSEAILTDLDTPEAWAAYRADRDRSLGD